MKRLINDIGILRLGLIALAVLVATFTPDPQARVVLAWPEIVPTLIAPVVAPLALMCVLLDLLMARVMAAEAEAAERRRLTRISWLDLALAVALVFRWTPFFMSLGRAS